MHLERADALKARIRTPKIGLLHTVRQLKPSVTLTAPGLNLSNQQKFNDLAARVFRSRCGLVHSLK